MLLYESNDPGVSIATYQISNKGSATNQQTGQDRKGSSISISISKGKKKIGSEKAANVMQKQVQTFFPLQRTTNSVQEKRDVILQEVDDPKSLLPAITITSSKPARFEMFFFSFLSLQNQQDRCFLAPCWIALKLPHFEYICCSLATFWNSGWLGWVPNLAIMIHVILFLYRTRFPNPMVPL